MSTHIVGTLISDPNTGLLYFAPHHYRDGATAFRERRSEFRHVSDESPEFAALTAQMRRCGDVMPSSPGEYVEIE